MLLNYQIERLFSSVSPKFFWWRLNKETWVRWTNKKIAPNPLNENGQAPLTPPGTTTTTTLPSYPRPNPALWAPQKGQSSIQNYPRFTVTLPNGMRPFVLEIINASVHLLTQSWAPLSPIKQMSSFLPLIEREFLCKLYEDQLTTSRVSKHSSLLLSQQCFIYCYWFLRTTFDENRS